MAGEDTVRYVVQTHRGGDEWIDVGEVDVPARTKRHGVIARAYQERLLAIPAPGGRELVRVLDEASRTAVIVGSKARDPELVIGVEEEPA